MKNKILEKKAIKWNNIYYECEGYILLNIAKAETNESYDIFIDNEDFELVSKGQWFVLNPRKDTKLKDIYNVLWTKKKNGKQCNYHIYQLILGTKNKNMIVDHINMNRFDNRRENLRIVDAKTNRINQNPKGYSEKDNLFYTCIKINNSKTVYSRGYGTGEEAMLKYIQACIICGRHKNSEFIRNKIKQLNINIDCNNYDYTDYFLKNVLNVINGKEADKCVYATKPINKTSNIGYYFDKSTNKFLSRIMVNGKTINIGRYYSELEAEEIYLKCCILLGNDKISVFVKHKIEELKITLTEEDYKNKYIKKILNIINDEKEDISLNGKYNLGYLDNMGLIITLVSEGKSWNYIAKYLVENKLIGKSKSSTAKKYYEEYINNNQFRL